MKGRIVLLLFFSGVLFSLLTPIDDPDFFWHLATGKWIYEHKELPKEDPFSYTTSLQTQKEISTAKTMLTQYWLANLIQYGVYKAGYYPGIIALRLAIALCILLILLLRLKEMGLSITASIVILLPLAYLLTVFKGDRPNQMTFLFLAVFLFLLPSLKKGKNIGYLLPFSFLVWANIHGGFILGTVISLIYIFSELIRWLLARKGVLPGYPLNKKLLFFAVVTVIAGMVNPNGYLSIYRLSVRQASFTYKTTENFSPLAYMHQGNYTLLFSTMSLFVLSLFSIFLYILLSVKGTLKSCKGFDGSPPLLSRDSSRQNIFVSAISKSLEEILLVIFLGSLAFTAVRYLPLFAIAVTPIIGQMLLDKPDLRIKQLSKFLIPEMVALVAFCLVAYGAYPATLLKKPIIGSDYPVAAVKFIKEHGIEGRVFNYIDWGGYLIWNFYPEKVVFTDGRILSQKLKKLYLSVSNGSRESIMGEPAYQAVLDTYSVKHILIPPVDLTGYFLPLVPVLVNDPAWRLIFTSENCLFFTKERFEPAFPKSIAYDIAIQKSLDNIRSDPDNPEPYLSIAKSYAGLGRRDKAISFLKNALQSRNSLRGGPVERTLILLEEDEDDLVQ